ncbi:MAG: ATP-binding protein [Deltaproteobacteria bacterium]|nr:ATP-binding protein [Deltaproteobacteria bacterium]
MIIAVASGKGGTGKTTIATNLAKSIGEGAQLIDCDVEEPNSHLFLNPQIEKSEEVCVPRPKVDLDKCTYCGDCAKICRFSAIVVVKKHVLVFPELCHGCGGCSKVCPEEAISEIPNSIGIVEQGKSHSLSFIHGRLEVGQAMSPPLIKAARGLAAGNGVVIIDSPPGTSCPVIASIKGSDFCILVTEPTPFGLNDLELAVEVVFELGIPAGVVINRSDIGDLAVKEFCQRRSIPILMEIPEDRQIAEAYSRGEMIIDVMPEYKLKFQQLFAKIEEISTGITG